MDAPAPFEVAVDAFADGVIGPVRYADPTTADRFAPDGVVFDADGVLWVYSAAQPRQLGFRRLGDGWERAGERLGPLRTRRCVRAPPSRRVVCAGEREPGGLVDPADAMPVDPSGPRFRAELAPRGGYRDVAAVGGRLYVLDAVDDVVVALDLDGHRLDAPPVALPAAAYRIGPLGDDALWVLAGVAPHLAVIPLDPDGAPGAPLGVDALGVPVRDAAYDPATGYLWTVGPMDRPVRRIEGPMVGPGTELIAWDAVALLAGHGAPIVRHTGDGVDGVRIVTTGTGPAVSYAGSDALGWGGALVPAGLGPAGLAWSDGALAVAATQSDAVHVLGEAPAVLRVDDRPRDRLVDEGLRLLTTPAPWPNGRATCTGCHWDGLADHRRHPGVRETRFEQTRPLAGAGALAPIFTPGQARSLAEAVEFLIRGLDDRFYAPPADAWWLTPRTVHTDGGPRVLDAERVREAMLAAITSWPVERGPLFGAVPADTWGRGVRLLIRDCVRCHEPVEAVVAGPGARPRIANAALPSAIGARALPFSAPRFARAGPAPFTSRGNRVPPLWQLDRGGPFLSDGSAPTLDALLRRTDPGGTAVHGLAPADPPVYDDADRAALIAVLLSL